MSEAAQIIAECERRGVVLTLAQGFGVGYDAPAGALTPELRARLAEHKPDVAQLLLEREERAALSGCPDATDAGRWARVMSHPAILKLQSLGLCHSILELRPMKRGRRAA